MNADTEALIKRIANGEATEADAEKVRAFIEASDAYDQAALDESAYKGGLNSRINQASLALLKAREALK